MIFLNLGDKRFETDFILVQNSGEEDDDAWNTHPACFLLFSPPFVYSFVFTPMGWNLEHNNSE